MFFGNVHNLSAPETNERPISSSTPKQTLHLERFLSYEVNKSTNGTLCCPLSLECKLPSKCKLP